MNTYEITVNCLGVLIKKLEGIQAYNALEAILRVEGEYPQMKVTLSDKNGSITTLWTGYEFTARRMSMILS